jgi:hypothetical protein
MLPPRSARATATSSSPACTPSYQRVEVLLTLLGGQQRVSLSREAIEPG